MFCTFYVYLDVQIKVPIGHLNLKSFYGRYFIIPFIITFKTKETKSN